MRKVEDPELMAWRTRRLVGAGFSFREAYQLARDGGVDLHALLELIDRGCPPVLAVRITAPLDPDQTGSSEINATSESCSSRQAGQPSR